MINDRVLTLMEEALMSNDTSHVYLSVTKDQMETFALLIVQECVHAVVNTSDRYRREYFADKIKEHFGLIGEE